MSLIIQCDGDDCYNREGYDCYAIYSLTKKASKIIEEFTREECVYYLCPECVEKYNEKIEGGKLIPINFENVEFFRR